MKVLVIIITLLVVEAAAKENQTLDGCQTECGGVPILFPFGAGKSTTTGKKCFLEETFGVTCVNGTLYSGEIQVLSINIAEGQVDAMVSVAGVCAFSPPPPGSQYIIKNNDANDGSTVGLTSDYSFSVSSKDNKFITVGCDSYGYLNSFDDDTVYSTGCLTRCYGNTEKVVDGSCSGIGCCQVDIPPGMRNISIQAFSFENFNRSLWFNNCSYSFVVKNGNYTFSKSHLENLPYKMVPMVIDWSVGGETCESSRTRGTNACNGNSTCVNSDTGYGYRCNCDEGFQGNPYHPDGCTDIDECKIGNHTCISEQNCLNTIGSFECFCPKGQSGNGTKEKGCQKPNDVNKFVLSASGGFITFFVGSSSLYLIFKKRNLKKMKENFFKQNGGIILLQQLSAARKESPQTAQIFTANELKKATNNYDENLIIGKGGFGIVFKGFLPDNRTIAVKKSKIVDQSQIEQFINEVVVLSQINHRNVVKLLGCCLETEVPLLVYEFINNGTLFDAIHNGDQANGLTWKNRLRIAAEAAGALSYLHSAASIPIVHRDVKSSNILLDESYAAKFSDFGASRLVPLDQTALATMVQGTIGYLDPEYMQTSRLTEKSDVYSFGVVLLELLTGEKPLSFDRSEEERSLAIYFISCLKENRLFDILQDDIILNEENKQEIMEVAILARKCLRLIGKERPSMKEVAMELERIRLMHKHHVINGGKILQETHHQHFHSKSSSKIYENNYGDTTHQIIGCDSIWNQLLVDIAKGR